MSMPQSPEATSFRVGLTQEERELYSRLFKALDSGNSGVITGEKARATFEKSGLPANILGEIWQLADVKNLGFLTQFGFCHAMRLIGYTQAGHYPTAQLAETPGPLPKFADMYVPSQQLLRSSSTGSSLLQTQPSSIIPQNITTQQSMPQAPIGSVSAADFEKYSEIYVRTTGSKTGFLDGNTAKQILMKAKLSTAILGQIWNLVDVKNHGYLDLPSFVMAMHLIHGLLSGSLKQLPPFLPEHVWKSVNLMGTSSTKGDLQAPYSSVGSQQATIRRSASQQISGAINGSSARAPAPAQAAANQSEWQVTASQKQQFDSIFDTLDKAKTGSLAAPGVASFLMTSRLDQQDLATIWDLADIQNTGIFSKLEFGIALFLINRRRSGQALPDVVPQELISSLQQTTGVSKLSQLQEPKITQQTPVAQKSSMDELADIFATPSAPLARPPERHTLQHRASSSDLTQANEIPKLSQHLTSSFKPSSTFGQSLVGNTQTPKTEPANLIGEDVVGIKSPEASRSFAPETQQSNQYNKPPVETRIPPNPSPVRQNTVDYQALRSVPPPPRARATGLSSAAPESVPRSSTFAQVPLQDNNDLLADAEVSEKLSEATSDIANFSNQIKSLTTQTSNLHEKKLRAEKELARILSVKEEINTKLQSLRASYASEVKLVEQVELNLANAKEEFDALRSEASIAEAKFNNITNEFHEKQLAVEEKQKANSSLKEKLGNLNAEIAALQGEHERKATENNRLSNDLNVKKSQVQVALVQVDELRRSIADLESSNSKYSDLIRQHENERALAESRAAELRAKREDLTNNFNDLQLKYSSFVANAVESDVVDVSTEVETEKSMSIQIVHSESDAETNESHSIEIQSKADEGDIQDDQKHSFAHPQIQNDDTNSTGDDTIKMQLFSFERENTNIQPNSTEFTVASMVDEVKNHPVGDLTGLNDVQTSEQIDSIFNQSRSMNIEPPKETFKPETYVAGDYEQRAYQMSTNRESLSSAATGSYKQAGGTEVGETPITSPANSDYRFLSSNAGVVGGLVGMPGVLVGVQRTDSLTSSVQNNPSMSVRDDNIDEVSDRDTLEDNATFPDHTIRGKKQSEGRLEDSSEGERISSGVESFEIVNSEEVKGAEETKGTWRASEVPTHPLAQSYRASELSSGSGGQPIEEFPPVRELDYDESSSDESERDVDAKIEVEEAYDDAHDDFARGVELPSFETESEFGDLKPAVIETETKQSADDFFDEDFDNLQLADDDHQSDIDTHDIAIDDHFTGTDDMRAFNQPMPDFSSNTVASQNENDEWEQLFAGFGNAAPAVQESNPVGAPHESAVSELVAMGFEKNVVVEALEKSNFDVESATNYLLDHA